MGSHQLSKKKFREAQDLARRKAVRSPYDTITIVCEDSKSSPSYFKELVTHLRLNTANIIVVPSKGSAPINVVDSAIERAKNTPDIDHVACVFDRDSHESYKRALNKLKQHKPEENDKSKPRFKAITSTPCYEIWLLLHFRYTAKPYNASGNKSAAEVLISELCKELPSYKKGTIEWFDKIINNLDAAILHAKRLQKDNRLTKSTNPSTNMHELVVFLKELKK